MKEEERHELEIVQKHSRMLEELVKLIDEETPQCLGMTAGRGKWALHRGRLLDSCTREVVRS
jgi:hypothetical protein